MKTKAVRTTNRFSVGRRIAAPLLGLALGAWSTLPLHAGVIDDMSGRRPLFVPEALGTSFVTAELVNGQLVFTGEFTDYPNDREDGIIWPNSLPVGELNGRTLELRIDVVRISENDVFLLLGVGGDGGGYFVTMDNDEIAVLKFRTQ